MDPNANIAEQLELARTILRPEWDADEVTARLAELVIALDEWRSKGGFAPAAASNEMRELAAKLSKAETHVISAAELRRDTARLAELVLAGAETNESPPADWLLEIHRMLYPERYPRELQPDHVYWQGRDEDEEDELVTCPQCGGTGWEVDNGNDASSRRCSLECERGMVVAMHEPFQWSSETIEWVAEMLQRALANDPRAVLKP